MQSWAVESLQGQGEQAAQEERLVALCSGRPPCLNRLLRRRGCGGGEQAGEAGRGLASR